MNALILVLVFFLFLAFNTPIALALVFTCLAYLTFLSEMPVTFLASTMIGSLEHYSLIAIPLFIFAAQIMNISKVTDRIFDFAKTLTGHFTGSLGHANIVASIIFAGMSGSALADAAGLGRVEIEGMTKEGYDKGPEVASRMDGHQCHPHRIRCALKGLWELKRRSGVGPLQDGHHGAVINEEKEGKEDENLDDDVNFSLKIDRKMTNESIHGQLFAVLVCQRHSEKNGPVKT